MLGHNGLVWKIAMADETNAIRPRIILADGHPQVRKLLSAQLQRESSLEVIAVTSDSDATFQQVTHLQPDTLLIDPIMQDGMGLATLRQIRKTFPSVQVIVLTAFVDTTLKLQLHEMGIHSILAKGISFSQLLSELKRVSDRLL